MKRFLPLLIIPLLLCTTCEDKNTFLIYGELTKKVLLIGVDGLSSTRLGEFNLPNHDRLITDGLYEDGTTVNSRPSYSGPGWSDILCGVNNAKHGVRNNNFTGSNFNQWPNFLERLEGIDPSFNTYAIVSWSGFDHIFENNAIDSYHRPSGDSVAEEDKKVRDIAKDILANDNPDAMYVYFHNVDTQGHAHGGSSIQYRDAAETIDGHIGVLINAVESRPTFNDENWLIMISSDHGHRDGGGHGRNSNHELSVYMVMSGPSVLVPINGATDNTYFAPTAMAHVLGYLDSEWNLDGQMVGISIPKASNPSPSDGAGPAGISEILSWNQGSDMVSQDVYFGINYTLDAGELKSNQTSSSYYTGTLNTNTTYYWRIDTNTPSGTVTGDVWSFTTTSGNDLISYWRLDDGSGNTAIDQGPYNLDGTLNGASWTDGQIGGALVFDGNDYVDMGSPDLGLDTTVTFSAWIYPQAENGVIAMQGFSHAAKEHGWVVAIGWDDWASSESDPKELVWASHDNSSNANNAMLVASPALIIMDRWQHIAVTKDGTEIKMYLDGQLIHTESIVATTITYNEGTNLRLGTRTASCSSHFSSSFNGRIDEVGIWKRALSIPEIADVMLNGP